MKGILLAGGSGTRLYPLTLSCSKQLLPIYDKPVIYYPLATLMLAGIREIVVISTPRDLPPIQNLLGDGSTLGLKLTYREQPKPQGIAQAFHIARQDLIGSPVCLILGDNLFFGNDMEAKLLEAQKLDSGACIFTYPVHDPERYGVVELDRMGQPVSVEEKPKNPKSNLAVTGLYFYDASVFEKATQIKPSARGELEISDINEMYLKEKTLRIVTFGRGSAWLDTGTFDSLLDASLFVRTIEQRQGLKISCIEEIAYHKNFITREQLLQIAEKHSKNGYGDYLKKLAISHP